MIKGLLTTDALVLLFLFFSLTLAIIIKSLQKKFRFLPYTPTLFVVSILMGKYAQNFGVIGQAIKATAQIDPRGILLIFLPPLIFQSSFNSDWYVFRRQAKQIFILAFPSVMVSAFAIMFFIKVLIGYDNSYYDYPQAFMFGSILSCTDTVAVLALLKQAGAPKKFSSLIQGQSLLNDGTCMILFTISLQLCKGNSLGITDIFFLFLELTCGAVLLGVVFGITVTQLIKLFKNMPLLCFNVTLVGCYFVYFIAQYVDLGIRISGIMALVSMGLYIAAFGRTKFTTQSRQRVHHIWKVYVFVAQTVIFILGGMIVGFHSLNNPDLIDLIGTKELIFLLLLYVGMTFARFFSIGVFMWKLAKLGYGLTWKEVIALTYGGLRGAVGIAFTLILASNHFLPQKFRYISVFNMAGCAFLTLMINAPTCSSVIIRLGLCVKSDAKKRLFNQFMKFCKKQLKSKLRQVTDDKYLNNANLDKVHQYSGLKDLQQLIQANRIITKTGVVQPKSQVGQPPIELKLRLLRTQTIIQYQDDIDEGILAQIRRRFGLALKGIFWRKFENKQCSDQTIKKLIEAIDLDLDSSNEPLNSCDYLLSEQKSTFVYDLVYWLRDFPIVNNYAFGLVYQRISILYELVQTYIQGLEHCQKEAVNFPFGKRAKATIIKQANQNRHLAQNYLQTEIKHSFPEIMKKIKKSKVALSLLYYQLQLLQQNYQQGRVQQIFYFEMRLNIQKRISKIQNQSASPQQLPTPQSLQDLDPFLALSKQQFRLLLNEHEVKLIQKDEMVIRSYQRMRYLYFIAKGEVYQQWKLLPNQKFQKRHLQVRQYLGLGELYRDSGVDYSALATSVTCLYGFPITRIKQLMQQNQEFQTLMYQQMLPVIIQITKQFNLPSIPRETWLRLKSKIKFKKLQNDQKVRVDLGHIILLQGKIQVPQGMVGPGHYHIPLTSKAFIHGPAKCFISQQPILIDSYHSSNKRISSKRVSEALGSSLRKSETPTIYDKVLFGHH